MQRHWHTSRSWLQIAAARSVIHARECHGGRARALLHALRLAVVGPTAANHSHRCRVAGSHGSRASRRAAAHVVPSRLCNAIHTHTPLSPRHALTYIARYMYGFLAVGHECAHGSFSRRCIMQVLHNYSTKRKCYTCTHASHCPTPHPPAAPPFATPLAPSSSLLPSCRTPQTQTNGTKIHLHR